MDVSFSLILTFLFFICGAQAWFYQRQRSPTVCFKLLKLGCFQVKAPFTNTQLLPRHPKELGVKFRFFNDHNRYHTLGTCRLHKIKSRNVYKPELKTKVIIHGFQDRGNNKWVKNMVKELLKKEKMNVIVVDWRKGASVMDYQQAVADIRVVGAIIAVVLEKLELAGADSKNIHLIGQSLGAHIAGHAGRRNGRIGRITGLDPAGPLFEGEDPLVRLDQSDAEFVDVLHTDAAPFVSSRMGLGIKQKSGHVDFYPNGGLKQPGCPGHITYMLANFLSGRTTSFVGAFACSHMRSVDMFTASINSGCNFDSYRCPSEAEIQEETCSLCENNECPQMGYHASVNSTSGLYFVPTTAKRPFCIEETTKS